MAFSTFDSQSSQVIGPQTLTLFKLSFCTTPDLRSNLLWTHLPNRDDLFAVFDTVFGKDIELPVTEKKVLKLVRGSELLDTVDLENLAWQARADEGRSRSQHLQDIDRHVIVMIKKPLLAIRYQLGTGQFRRLQMNFRPESGFDVAHSALRALGLPIRERNQPANPFTSFAPMPTLPLTSQGSQHYQPANVMPGLDFMSRPTTSNGTSNYTPLIAAPATSSERPATAPMSFSQMLPPRRELPFAKRPPEPQLPPPTEPPAENPSSDRAQDDQKPPAKRKPRAEPAKARKARGRAAVKKATTGETSQELGLVPDSQGPSSQAGPSKPAKAKKARGRAAVTKATSGETSKQLESVADSQGPSSQVGPSKPAADDQPIQTDQAVQATKTPSALGGVTASNIPLISMPNVENPTNTVSPALGPDISKKVMASLPASESNACQDNGPSAHTQASTNASQLSQVAEVAPEEFMSRLDEWVRKYQDLPAPRPREAPPSDLAAYAAQSDEDRQAAIDSMICDCLEDENFVKLVEDVERSWKRIGLGF